jgi:glycosyltransferase involved in cell wall biosynthesis
MRILQVLTYYRPWVSGLTIYVERLARGLVKAGHQVTVLSSAYDRTLPLAETSDGVVCVRAPVAFRVSKGVVMPQFGFMARWLMSGHDVVHLHLPQFDGAGLALNARAKGKPSVLTYHCDVSLPPGLLNRVVQPVIDGANEVAARTVNRIVAYTDDYARHSHLLKRHLNKVTVIPPPVEIASPTSNDLAEFTANVGLPTNGARPLVVGMAARLATEKGVEVLLDAMEIVREHKPNARVLFAGPYQNVLGEEAYAARLKPRFDALGPSQWTFLGSLHGRALSAFFGSCDVHVLPSLNSTESFGLVQVESMLCGTPSICSDLPGVRVSPTVTGMGAVTPIGDAPALARAILEVSDQRARYVKPRAEIEGHFSTAESVRRYEALYRELLRI